MSFSKSYRVCLLASTLIATFNVAQAQTSVFEKSRPEYDAKGIRLGSFEFNPKLNVEERFDDNIYSTDNNEVNDEITIVSPLAALNSDWNRHEFNLYAKGDFAFYSDNTSENYEDFSIGVNGRLDVLRDTFITAGFDYEDKHENRGAPDNNVNSVEPNEYTEITGRLGFYRGLSKLFLKVDGEISELDFEDGRTINGVNIDNDDRDRTQYKSTVRLGYEFIENYNAFIQGSYNIREYDDTSVLDRGSEGYEIVAGTAIDISGKTKGEVYVGYITQDYDDPTLQEIDDITFGASVLWNASPITSVKAGIDRSIQETAIDPLTGFVATNYSINAEHELKRNILIGAGFSFATNDYEGLNTVERSDDIIRTGVEATYLINRNLATKLTYTYVDRSSNIVNQDFNKNIVGINLTVGF